MPQSPVTVRLLTTPYKMDSQDFGLWVMLAFWSSAVGGIFLAVKWANRRSKKSPVSKDIILLSLKDRLDDGTITQEEYEKRCKNL